jgi:lipopolysaccharide transport system ATP-binding protein
MKPILEIQNISKEFTIGHQQQPYLSLRDSLHSIFKSSERTEKFNALNDISFNVEAGEIIGIIGKNGAGKSTLLKVLSKITPPTSGKIISRGRIASLLEVGTGFHPELSGRENVFLNGSILGMKKKEIQAKFDEIIDFSGTEQFLDTALKHYSSGMQLRLAFAVAAFLEPEILVIDEVLAVGDAEFQKKCMGKMEDVSKGGRTILFVSHNMASMKSLCGKGILLKGGKLAFEGNMSDTIEQYLSTATKALPTGDIPENASVNNTGIVRFTKIILNDKNNIRTECINYRSGIYLTLELEALENIPDVMIDIRIVTLDGIYLAHAMNKYSTAAPSTLTKGRNSVYCKILNQLQPGQYSITLGIHLPNGSTLEYVENILNFHVLNVADNESEGFTYNYNLCYVHFDSEWRIESQNS